MHQAQTLQPAISESKANSACLNDKAANSVNHPQSADKAVGRDALAEVRGITPGERERAIELCELREIWFEAEGLHQNAEHMRELARQLIDGRTNVRSF